jgi:hypothetical protein
MHSISEVWALYDFTLVDGLIPWVTTAHILPEPEWTRISFSSLFVDHKLIDFLECIVITSYGHSCIGHSSDRP